MMTGFIAVQAACTQIRLEAAQKQGNKSLQTYLRGELHGFERGVACSSPAELEAEVKKVTSQFEALSASNDLNPEEAISKRSWFLGWLNALAVVQQRQR